MTWSRRCTIALAAPLLLPSACHALPPAGTAFPGAEGFGRFAKGGRGGAIIQITNLNDSGPGSLRACIDAAGPRVCVFRVGGVIRFTSKRPVIHNPYLTIAGETAPGGGILLTHAGGPDGLTPLAIKNSHDIVIRHIRVRTDLAGAQRGSNDAFTIDNSRNVILDHVSGSWALDENVNSSTQADDITISWSIFAEGIIRHDKCALLGSDPTGPQQLSFIKNLCADNGDRNPDMNFTPGSCVEVINNVFYNGQHQFAEVWETYGGSPVNIVGNYFKAGPNTASGTPAIDRQVIGSTGRARIYLEGNRLDGDLVDQSPPVAVAVVPLPVCELPDSILDASGAYTQVLDHAGAFPRDAVDRRIVSEVRERGGSLKRRPGVLPSIAGGTPYPDADHDGMSDTWERENGLDPAVNDAWADKDGNGWANLEEFLDYAHRRLLAGRIVP
ncbi:MAG TPA: pectate lyase [Allosphingosinicella sp.]